MLWAHITLRLTDWVPLELPLGTRGHQSMCRKFLREHSQDRLRGRKGSKQDGAEGAVWLLAQSREEA